MYDRVMRIFAILSIALLIGVVVGVVWFSKGKDKVYVSLENYANGAESNEMKLVSKETLNIQITDLEEADLAIPLLPEVVEKDILVESDYRKHIVYITINNMPNDYFRENFISAKEGFIIESYCEYRENQITLEIHLGDLYENEIVFKNGILFLDFSKPNEIFDHIVLINLPDEDIEGIDLSGQSYEEPHTLEVAKRVRSLFSNSDTKVYLLRTKEEPLTLEERIKFTKELKPDMTIIIDVAKGVSVLEEGIATYYNETYFIPFFGNEQFADHIEYYTLKETEATVLGIFSEKKEESFLYNLEMPSARIDIGYITNSKERKLLDDEEYLNKIALGIYNGILKSQEAMEAIEVR